MGEILASITSKYRSERFFFKSFYGNFLFSRPIVLSFANPSLAIFRCFCLVSLFWTWLTKNKHAADRPDNSWVCEKNFWSFVFKPLGECLNLIHQTQLTDSWGISRPKVNVNTARFIYESQTLLESGACYLWVKITKNWKLKCKLLLQIFVWNSFILCNWFRFEERMWFFHDTINCTFTFFFHSCNWIAGFWHYGLSFLPRQNDTDRVVYHFTFRASRCSSKNWENFRESTLVC